MRTLALILTTSCLGCMEIMAQSIELAVQKGHSGDITFVVFNSDGKFIASAGTDNLIKLWHVPTGKEMASFVSASTLPITALRFQGEGEYLYVQYKGGAVHTWDIAASALRDTLSSASATGHFVSQTRYVTQDSSFEYFLEGYYLRKKDRHLGKALYSKVPIDISQHFTTLAVSEAHQKLVTACRDGKVYVFDSQRGKNLATLEDHLASVNSICFAPDGRLFASASSDRSIIIWDTETLLPVKRLFSRAFRFESIAFDPSGTRLAAGDELGTERIIDLASSQVNVDAFPLHGQKIGHLAFDPTGNEAFSAGYDNRLVEFDLQATKVSKSTTYRHFVSFGNAFLKMLGAHSEPFAWVNSVAVSPSGRYVAAGGGWKEAEVRRQPQPLILMDKASGKKYKLKAHQGGVSALAFISDFLVVTGHHENLFAWYHDPASGKFYFREHRLPSPANIRSIHPVGKDTLVINAGKKVIWFSLKSEQVIREETATHEITALAVFGPRNEVIFAEGHDLVIVDQTGIRRVIKQAHTDRITSMSLSPTRPVLATASWDATIRLWNSDTGELLATLVAVGNADHIIVTPDNFYFGTRNSLKGIGFKFGRQFISPEQFDLKFNRPDIIVDRLGYTEPNVRKSYRRAYLKRLQKLNFTEEMLKGDIHLPEIKIRNDRVPLHTDQQTLTFRVEASDSRHRINRINVLVNQVPLFGIAGIELRGRNLKTVLEEITVQLAAGKNRIQFSCLNEQGTESLFETFEVECTRSPKKPDLYLAVISVSAYDNTAKNLKYAAKDGRDLVSLYSRRADAFRDIHIDTLFDEQATRENIVALKERLKKSSVEDQVVLYVSGHGLLDDNLDFYFATHDLDFEDPATRGMKYDELENLLDGIPARKKLLLMDACHSGEVDKGQLRISDTETLSLDKGQKGTVKRYNYAPESGDEGRQIGMKTSFELMQELFTNLSKGSGSVVISAAAGNSYALESDEWKNGIFTYCLLAGLKSGKADANDDGEITVTELKAFVSREVERLTQGEQKPTSRRENLEFDFVVW